jgi:hypothetical protein
MTSAMPNIKWLGTPLGGCVVWSPEAPRGAQVWSGDLYQRGLLGNCATCGSDAVVLPTALFPYDYGLAPPPPPYAFDGPIPGLFPPSPTSCGAVPYLFPWGCPGVGPPVVPYPLAAEIHPTELVSDNFSTFTDK